VNAAKSKAEKYKARMVELKISENRLEKLNKVFETEMVSGKEFNKIMNNKILNLEQRIASTNQREAMLRNEIFGVKPA
jgi:hypothetical protein